MTDGLELRSEAVTPEQLDPADHERSAENGRPEHYLHGDKSLIPACRYAGDQFLNEVQFLHYLREVVAGLSGLAESEVLGIEVVGHVRIINRGVVNNRFTASDPSSEPAPQKSEDRDPR